MGKGWFFGLGFWTRGNAESVCLLSKETAPKFQPCPSVSYQSNPEDTAKSPKKQEKIEKLMGDLPSVELFAREEGWDAWETRWKVILK